MSASLWLALVSNRGGSQKLTCSQAYGHNLYSEVIIMRCEKLLKR